MRRDLFCVLPPGIRLALQTALVCAGPWASVPACAQVVSRPNVLVIVTDDASYSDYGFSAGLNNWPTHFDTPNLDALAQESMVLSQAYVASPLCSPSRAGLLTGQYQQRYGYEENLGNAPGHAVSSGTWGLAPEQITIAQRLKDVGYTTGAVGKWHLGYADGVNRPLDKGFDEFYGMLGGGRSYWTEGTLERGIFRNNEFYEAQYRVEGDQTKYDPVNGRYLTDAFGEEAVSFINRHAGEEDPFFLYMAITAPHDPYQAKQADLAQFAHIADPTRRTMAAMVHAMDRSVGDVLNALEANQIDDETMIVFLNDNGGLSYFGNSPFKGHKGTMMEGGIRVPFMIKAPGVQPGVYDGPITAYDVLPTIVAAAGGDPSLIPSDGHNVMPVLTGQQPDPHGAMFWREFDNYAVLKDGWKLTSHYRDRDWEFLFNVEQDPGESVYLQNVNLPKRAELTRELTNWEATLAKPKWGALSVNNQNTFDHFVFRNDQAPVLNWNTANSWRQSDTTSNATLRPTDAYANAIIEFQTRDDDNFTASNNMTRTTEFTFMLNQLRLSGDFNGLSNRQGTINGKSLLFVKNLHGDGPQIRLDATSSADASRFTFRVDLELQLLHDLEIAGNGTENFVINSAIRDYYIAYAPTITDPHSVTKSGTSHVTLAGNNTFRGTLTVTNGKMTLDGQTAAVDGAAAIVVGSAGEFELASGLVNVQSVDNSAGGTFDFHGGTLKTVNVLGDLTNDGGTFSPGASPALSAITGDFTQNAGKLEIEIGGAAAGAQYDKLIVNGAADLGGVLEVKLINGFAPAFGQAFHFLAAAGGIVGQFDNIILPALAGGKQWSTQFSSNMLSLIVGLAGDFNLDGSVDAADYTIWRDTFGQSVTAGEGADANRDGQVNEADYTLWKNNFGAIVVSGTSSASSGAVPEPSTLVLVLFATLLAGTFRNGRRKR